MAVDNIARGMAAKALENQGGGGSSLPIVNTAAIGQTIRVSAVDENGQPTEWEAVEFPVGGDSSGFETIFEEVLTEASTIQIEDDQTKNEIWMFLICPPGEKIAFTKWTYVFCVENVLNNTIMSNETGKNRGVWLHAVRGKDTEGVPFVYYEKWATDMTNNTPPTKYTQFNTSALSLPEIRRQDEKENNDLFSTPTAIPAGSLLRIIAR